MKHVPSRLAKETICLFRLTIRKSSENKLFQQSAALAYYAMFSIGPLLVLTFGLAGIAFGHDAIRHQIDQELQSLFGKDTAGTLDSMMTSHRHGGTKLASLAGLIALLFGATGVYSQLQYSMNAIWEVRTKPGQGAWNLIRTRFLSLAMVLGTGFLLLISLVLTTFLTAISGRFEAHLALSAFFIRALNAVGSFTVIAALFAMIFKYLPDVVIPLRKVWVGAVGTAVLFEAGKYVLSFYLGREGFASSYGAAGTVIALLMWVYYGSLILFLGAEFTQVSFTRANGPPRISSCAIPAAGRARPRGSAASSSDGKASRLHRATQSHARTGIQLF